MPRPTVVPLGPALLRFESAGRRPTVRVPVRSHRMHVERVVRLPWLGPLCPGAGGYTCNYDALAGYAILQCEN